MPPDRVETEQPNTDYTLEERQETEGNENRKEDDKADSSDTISRFGCRLENYLQPNETTKFTSEDVNTWPEPAGSPTGKKNMEIITDAEKLLCNAEKQISRFQEHMPKLLSEFMDLNISDNSSENEVCVKVHKDIFTSAYEPNHRSFGYEMKEVSSITNNALKQDTRYQRIHDHQNNQICEKCLNVPYLQSLSQDANISLHKSGMNLVCQGHSDVNTHCKNTYTNCCHSFTGADDNRCNLCNFTCGYQKRHSFCEKLDELKSSAAAACFETRANRQCDQNGIACEAQNETNAVNNESENKTDGVNGETLYYTENPQTRDIDTNTEKGIPFRNLPNATIVNIKTQCTTTRPELSDSNERTLLNLLSKNLKKQTLPHVDIRPALTKQTGPAVHIPSTPKFVTKKERNKNIGVVSCKHESCADGTKQYYEAIDLVKGTSAANKSFPKGSRFPPNSVQGGVIKFGTDQNVSRFEPVINGNSKDDHLSNDQIQDRLRNVVRFYSDKLQSCDDNKITQQHEQLKRTLKLLNNIITRLYDNQMNAYIKYGTSKSVVPPLSYRMKMVADLLWHELEIKSHPTEEHCVQIDEILTYLLNDIDKTLMGNADNISKNVFGPPQKDGSSEHHDIGLRGLPKQSRESKFNPPNARCDSGMKKGIRCAEQNTHKRSVSHERKPFAQNVKTLKSKPDCTTKCDQGVKENIVKQVKIVSESPLENKRHASAFNMAGSNVSHVLPTSLTSIKDYMLKETEELQKLKRLKKVYELNRNLYNTRVDGDDVKVHCVGTPVQERFHRDKHCENGNFIPVLANDNVRIDGKVETENKESSEVKDDVEIEESRSNPQLNSENRTDDTNVDDPAIYTIFHQAEVHQETVVDHEGAYEDDWEPEEAENEGSKKLYTPDVETNKSDRLSSRSGALDVTETSGLLSVEGSDQKCKTEDYEQSGHRSEAENSHVAVPINEKQIDDESDEKKETGRESATSSTTDIDEIETDSKEDIESDDGETENDVIKSEKTAKSVDDEVQNLIEQLKEHGHQQSEDLPLKNNVLINTEDTMNEFDMDKLDISLLNSRNVSVVDDDSKSLKLTDIEELEESIKSTSVRLNAVYPEYVHQGTNTHEAMPRNIVTESIGTQIEGERLESVRSTLVTLNSVYPKYVHQSTNTHEALSRNIVTESIGTQIEEDERLDIKFTADNIPIDNDDNNFVMLNNKLKRHNRRRILNVNDICTNSSGSISSARNYNSDILPRKSVDVDSQSVDKPLTSVHFTFPAEPDSAPGAITMTSNIDNQEIKISFDNNSRANTTRGNQTMSRATNKRLITSPRVAGEDGFLNIQVNSPRMTYDEQRIHRALNSDDLTNSPRMQPSTSDIRGDAVQNLELNDDDMKQMIRQTVEEVLQKFKHDLQQTKPMTSTTKEYRTEEVQTDCLQQTKPKTSTTKEYRTEEVQTDYNLVKPACTLNVTDFVGTSGEQCTVETQASDTGITDVPDGDKKGVHANKETADKQTGDTNSVFNQPKLLTSDEGRRRYSSTTSTSDIHLSSSFSSSSTSLKRYLDFGKSRRIVSSDDQLSEGEINLGLSVTCSCSFGEIKMSGCKRCGPYSVRKLSNNINNYYKNRFAGKHELSKSRETLQPENTGDGASTRTANRRNFFRGNRVKNNKNDQHKDGNRDEVCDDIDDKIVHTPAEVTDDVGLKASTRKLKLNTFSNVVKQVMHDLRNECTTANEKETSDGGLINKHKDINMNSQVFSGEINLETNRLIDSEVTGQESLHKLPVKSVSNAEMDFLMKQIISNVPCDLAKRSYSHGDLKQASDKKDVNSIDHTVLDFYNMPSTSSAVYNPISTERSNRGRDFSRFDDKIISNNTSSKHAATKTEDRKKSEEFHESYSSTCTDSSVISELDVSKFSFTISSDSELSEGQVKFS